MKNMLSVSSFQHLSLSNNYINNCIKLGHTKSTKPSYECNLIWIPRGKIDDSLPWYD